MDTGERAPLRSRAISGVLRFCKIPLLMVAGYLLTKVTADSEVQDALQYRMNLEAGVYSRQETQSYFGFLVEWINGLLPALDPFYVIGGATAAAYLYVSLKSGARWPRYLLFLLLMALPLISLNFTQVLRQGIASAFIVLGLTAGSSLLFVCCLVAGALIHKVFAPVVAFMLIREAAFWRRRKTGVPQRADSARRPPREGLFDLVTFIMIPVVWILVLLYASNSLATDTYIVYDASNSKRIFVSVLLFLCVRLVYPSTHSRLATFTAYIVVSVAFILPVSVDFLRLHTLIIPFLALSALSCRTEKNGTYALALCVILSAYVMPVFGLSALF